MKTVIYLVILSVFPVFQALKAETVIKGRLVDGGKEKVYLYEHHCFLSSPVLKIMDSCKMDASGNFEFTLELPGITECYLETGTSSGTFFAKPYSSYEITMRKNQNTLRVNKESDDLNMLVDFITRNRDQLIASKIEVKSKDIEELIENMKIQYKNRGKNFFQNYLEYYLATLKLQYLDLKDSEVRRLQLKYINTSDKDDNYSYYYELLDALTLRMMLNTDVKKSPDKLKAILNNSERFQSESMKELSQLYLLKHCYERNIVNKKLVTAAINSLTDRMKHHENKARAIQLKERFHRLFINETAPVISMTDHKENIIDFGAYKDNFMVITVYLDGYAKFAKNMKKFGKTVKKMQDTAIFIMIFHPQDYEALKKEFPDTDLNWFFIRAEDPFTTEYVFPFYKGYCIDPKGKLIRAIPLYADEDCSGLIKPVQDAQK